MQCDNCGKEGAFIRRVTKSYGKDEDLILIEDIPMIHCPHCHETYLTAKTMHEIDAVRRNRKSAVLRPVRVAHLEPVGMD
ncbi:MAG: YgiT-type zinc finger protein [Calditrichota bacterium]